MNGRQIEAAEKEGATWDRILRFVRNLSYYQMDDSTLHAVVTRGEERDIVAQIDAERCRYEYDEPHRRYEILVDRVQGLPYVRGNDVVLKVEYNRSAEDKATSAILDTSQGDFFVTKAGVAASGEVVDGDI